MPQTYLFYAKFARTRSRVPDYYLVEESNANDRAWWQYTHRCLCAPVTDMVKGHKPNPYPSVGDVVSTIDGRTVRIVEVETLTVLSN